MCVHRHITGLFLRRQLLAVRDLSLPEAISCRSIHLLTGKKTHIDTCPIARNGADIPACAHGEGGKNPHIWCRGGGTFVGSWSDINCTQIKMDLAPAVGSVIHSDAAAPEDLSGVKSDASLSHPNTYHRREARGGCKQKLMHRITPCSALHPFHFPPFKVPHYFWTVRGY